jgi:hypothetical protein
MSIYHVQPAKLPFLRLMKPYKIGLKILKARRVRGGGGKATSPEDASWQWALNARDQL